MASVSVFCFRQDDPESFLVSLRTGTPDLLSYWQTAGGKIDEAEDPITAARRELEEETDVVADLNYLCFVDRTLGMKYSGQGGNLLPYHIYVFLYRMDGADQPRNMEPDKHGDWMMKSSFEIMALPCVPGLREMVCRFQHTGEPNAI